MRRHLFNLAAAVSLVLFVATAALWVRSYVATECFVYQRTEPVNRLFWKTTFVSSPGQIFISHTWVDFNADGLAEKYRESDGHPDAFSYLRYPPESRWKDGRFGFMFVLSDVHHGSASTLHFPRAYIPYWFVALITAVLPYVWWNRRRRHRTRLREHLCLVCGYDLRATPDGCPECGTAAHASAEAAA